MFMIQMRFPRVVLPNVKCVRQLQYLVFARNFDADLVSHHGNTSCGVFKRGGTKLEIFLPKNQHILR